MSNFKVGDKVKIVRKFAEGAICWEDYMDSYIETVLTVDKTHNNLFEVKECKWCFPIECAELVEENNDTQKQIELLFDNFKKFLKEKNIRYGDAAISPINIFSQTKPGDQIRSRIDDKLSRIKNSKELKKNDLSDLFGYIALLLIQNNWINFEEFLD